MLRTGGFSRGGNGLSGRPQRVSRARPARRACILVVVTLVGGASLLAGSASVRVAGQDRMVIDPEGGRRVFGGFEYAFRGAGGNAIDRRRGWLYDVESADLHRVQALSLDDGQVVRVYGAGEGDGPGELREINAVATASDGLIVASRNRVSRWDTDGRFLGTWSPGGSVADVCLLGDEPAAPVPGGIGVAYRTSDGETATIPPGTPPVGRSMAPERRSFGDRMSRYDLKIACGDDVAYVLSENRITGYPVRGAPFDVPIPGPVADDAAEAHARATTGYYWWYRSMSLEERGRIVLVNTFRARRFAGVVIAAGDDVLEAEQGFGGDVEGEAVPGDPAAGVDADEGDLSDGTRSDERPGLRLRHGLEAVALGRPAGAGRQRC